MCYRKQSDGSRKQGLLLPRTNLEFGYFLPDEEADLVSVIPGVIETAPRWFPIPASTARLLVVSGHGLGNIPVDDKPVGFKRTRYMLEELNDPHSDPV